MIDITLSTIITLAVFAVLSLLSRNREITGAKRIEQLIVSGFIGSFLAWGHYEFYSGDYEPFYFSFPIINIALVCIYYVYYHSMAAGELTAANLLILSYPLYWLFLSQSRLPDLFSAMQWSGFYILAAGTALTIIFQLFSGKDRARSGKFLLIALLAAVLMGLRQYPTVNDRFDYNFQMARFYFFTGVVQMILGVVVKYGFATKRPALLPVHFMMSAIGAMFFFVSLAKFLPFIIFPLPFVYLGPFAIFIVAFYFYKSGRAESGFSPQSIKYTAIVLLLMEMVFIFGAVDYYYIRCSPAAVFLCLLAVESWMELGEKFTYRKSFIVFIFLIGLTLLNNDGISGMGKGYYRVENFKDVITVLMPALRN